MTGPWLGTFAAAVLVVGLAMLGLAVGQIRGRAPLGGSCGGGACGLCANDRDADGPCRRPSEPFDHPRLEKR